MHYCMLNFLEWNGAEDFSSNEPLSKTIELIKGKNFIEAITLSESVMESENFRSKALALKGSVQFIKGDMNSAFETLTLSSQLNPKDSDVLIKLALVELET